MLSIAPQWLDLCVLHPESILTLIAKPSSLGSRSELFLPANRTHCKGHKCFVTLLGGFYVALRKALWWLTVLWFPSPQSFAMLKYIRTLNHKVRLWTFLIQYLQRWCWLKVHSSLCTLFSSLEMRLVGFQHILPVYRIKPMQRRTCKNLWRTVS